MKSQNSYYEIEVIKEVLIEITLTCCFLKEDIHLDQLALYGCKQLDSIQNIY